MTITQIRFVKRALMALLIVLTFYVGYHVWEGVRTRSDADVEPLDEPESLISREVEIEQLDPDGNPAWTLKAAESTGRTESSQQFRDVEIRFDVGDDEIPVVVTADHCEIRGGGGVYLEGDVVVRDDTSLRLEASTLEYRRGPERVWSNEPVRYFKEGLSGDAGSMRYIIRRGELDLKGGVDMVLQEEGKAPVRVRSRRAFLRRRQNWVHYVDRVRVRQANRALDCNDLQIYLTEDNAEIEHMEAYEAVDLRMNVEPEDDSRGDTGESPASPTAPASEPGLKRLTTEVLEIFLRPGGELLERVRALEGGTLLMTPPEGDRRGVEKRLEGYTLAFEFDEAGRLETLRGRGGVTLELTPVTTESGEQKKIVTARQLEADFDPETGELLRTRCERAVTFEQGDVRATGDYGTFLVPRSMLTLTESPRLSDSRASLEAEEIRIDVDSGDVWGERDVRSSSTPAPGEEGVLPVAGGEPVYFVAREMTFDRARNRAIYTGDARGFQGQNRIEGDRIEIWQTEGDLVASGDVRTVFLQELTGDEEATSEPTITLAGEFRYRAEADRLEYREDVEMRSRSMTLRGQSVDVTLARDGREVAEVFAQGEVEIETAEGRAAGETAKYLPEEERMTVEGEEAWLENAGKLTQGKQLTFFLTDDRIFVDGQEQSRTRTTYSSKPRPF